MQGSNNAVLDGRRLRIEKAKVNRTLFIAKMSRSITNQVHIQSLYSLCLYFCMLWLSS